MEDNFRNTLIIISAVVIGAIFVHGLWTIRKNKNPYKLKTSKDRPHSNIGTHSRDFDRSGFDQDGVGQIKIKSIMDDNSANSPSISANLVDTADTADTFDSSSVSESTKEVTELDNTLNVFGRSDNLNSSVNEDLMPSFEAIDAVDDTINMDVEHQKQDENNIAPFEKTVVVETVELPKVRVYQEPVIQPKPRITKINQTKVTIARDQMEINFGKVTVDDSINTDEDIPTTSAAKPEILAISVVMPANQIMPGASLLPSLLTLGMKYGEMNIFHRHQDNAGNGAVTFSLANMMNPGSFDLDSMETFATQGITLFMMLPNSGNAFDVFEQMLAAAKHLCYEFNAQLVDDKRNPMTKQTEQHYTSRIRDFEIKNRTAAF